MSGRENRLDKLRMTGIAAGAAARAIVTDLGAGFISQMDSKGNKVVAGGAALALVLGLGAGFLGLAPIERALTPHPMAPVPGTSQMVASLEASHASPSPPRATPVRAVADDATPTTVTSGGVAPPDNSQDAAPIGTPVDAQVDATGPQSWPSSRRAFGRESEAPSDYAPPWANNGPPRWWPPSPPPDDVPGGPD